MELRLVLCLPRAPRSVPAARHTVRAALRSIGVASDCADEIEVALSEACTNVLAHADPSDVYAVRLDLRDDHCVLRVIDNGTGFTGAGSHQDGQPPQPTATTGSPPVVDPVVEHGRGLRLMRALADRVRIDRVHVDSQGPGGDGWKGRGSRGTVVRLEKRLS
jgi:serine/threonine-protein kinase RsbW